MTSAPGKLVLLGEYAVLEGATALVMAVDRRALVRLEPLESGECIVESPQLLNRPVRVRLLAGRSEWLDLEESAREPLRLVSACLEQSAAVLAHEGREAQAAHLYIDTASFHDASGRKLGLGSSAAVAAALCGAWLAHGGLAFEGKALLQCALEAHARAQGGGSGVDVAASVVGGLVRFARRPESGGVRAERVARPAWLSPLVVWTGHSTSTADMVATVRRFAARDRKGYEALVRELSDTAARGCAAALSADREAFVAVVADYATLLDRLGRASGADIISLAHRRAATIVHARGGVYKPSGAGGGDLGIAFVPLGAEQETAAALEQAGLPIANLRFAEEGLTTGNGHERGRLPHT